MTPDVIVRKGDDAWEVYVHRRGWRRWFPGALRLQGKYGSAEAASRAAAKLGHTPTLAPLESTRPAPATDAVPGRLYADPRGRLLTEPYVPPTETGLQQFQCPVHGNVGRQIIHSNIAGAEGIWCMVCIVDKFDELGVQRVKPLGR